MCVNHLSVEHLVHPGPMVRDMTDEQIESLQEQLGSMLRSTREAYRHVWSKKHLVGGIEDLENGGVGPEGTKIWRNPPDMDGWYVNTVSLLLYTILIPWTQDILIQEQSPTPRPLHSAPCPTSRSFVSILLRYLSVLSRPSSSFTATFIRCSSAYTCSGSIFFEFHSSC